MDALEECHRNNFVKRAMGTCNFEKAELTKCLHYVRVEDSKDRIRVAREKERKREQRIKENQEQLYGKNNYLKKMIETEAERKLNNGK